jgi:hypothetical protein
MMGALTRALAIVVVLSSALCLAQGKPTLVDYPLDIKAALPQSRAEELQDDFRLLLVRNNGILVPTKSNWKSAVAALKRSDCDVRNECLQQLATTAGTLYALYASLKRNIAATQVTVTGRVVNQDGAVSRPMITVTVPLKRGATIVDAGREALQQLLTQLELEKLSPVLSEPAQPPAVANNPPPANAPPPPMVLVQAPPPPAAEQTGVSGLRIGAWVAGGAALASAAIAVGFGATALGARGTLPSDGKFTSPAQAQAQATVNQGATVALACGIGAAVLAATSATLFVVSAHPMPGGGAGISVGGRL